MRFVKMHGIGNDYVYVDAINDPSLAERFDLPELSRLVSDRHTGIGSDGLILLCPPERGVKADLRMRMFNADGSESEMCGNGIRCVCKLAHDDGLATANPMCIQTGAGVLSLAYSVDDEGKVERVTVDMGEPTLALPRVPVDPSKFAASGPKPHHHTVRTTDGEEWSGVFVSMGNPHVSFFADDHDALAGEGLARLDLDRIGPRIEHHPAFPRRINAHFVQVHARDEATMRTWERGSGITLACGTGACAVAVAGMLTDRFDREVLLHLPGGDLTIRWDEKTNHVFMTGPATEVYRGDWPEPRAARCSSPSAAAAHSVE